MELSPKLKNIPKMYNHFAEKTDAGVQGAGEEDRRFFP